MNVISVLWHSVVSRWDHSCCALDLKPMLYEDSVYKTRIWDLHFQVSPKKLKTLGSPCCSKFSSAP